MISDFSEKEAELLIKSDNICKSILRCTQATWDYIALNGVDDMPESLKKIDCHISAIKNYTQGSEIQCKALAKLRYIYRYRYNL